ncbi:MAG: ADOP family duplicated permease [Acidobacteriota bacterium]
MNRRLQPPRPAAWLIWCFSPAHDLSELLGDLHERYLDVREQRGRFRAWLWYWGQAFALALGMADRRIRKISAPRPSFLWSDFRLAVRSLQRSPALILAGSITLGIGIGAPSTLFAIVDGIMRPLPVDDPHKVVDVSLLDLQRGGSLPISTETCLAWQQSQAGFEALGAYFTDTAGVSSSQGQPRRYSGAYVTQEVFRILGSRPIAGRLFTPSDMRAGAPPVVVIREDVWEERFASSVQALGSVLRINGVFHTVVGVLPTSFAFPRDQQMWMPLDSHPFDYPIRLRLLGRLADGSSSELAEQKLLAVYSALPGREGSAEAAARVSVQEFVMAHMGRETFDSMQNVIRVISLLVVIAAVNLAGLLLARGSSRSRDVALRIAIGGSRLRVAGQLMAESLVLAVGGGILGLLTAYWGLAWCRSILEASANQAYWIRLELSPAVAGFTALLVLVAALTAGVIPSLRTSRVNLSEALKQDNLRSSSMRMGRMVPIIVGVEMALSCTLLLLSSLIVQGALENIRSASGFPTENVLTARLVLEDYDYPDEASRLAFSAKFQDSLRSAPGVERFSLMTDLPGKVLGKTAVRVEGRPLSGEARPAQQRLVNPSFFEMFELQLVEGRLLEERDRPGQPRVAVVNREFVRDFLKGEPATGRRLRLGEGGEAQLVEVVGVVSDPGVTTRSGEVAAGLYLPLAQGTPPAIRVALQARALEQNGLPALLAAVAAADAALPIGQVRTLAEVERRENAEEQLFGTLFGVFGGVALILAAVGLHGVVSFSVSQRRREIGIRRVLGALPRRVFWNTVAQGLRPAALGMAFGIGLAFLLAPQMGEVLYGSDPHDPWIYTLVCGLLLAICGLAAFAPARRASRLDPIIVLRAE